MARVFIFIFTLALALGTVHLLFTLCETIQTNANILFFFTSGARWWEECPEARWWEESLKKRLTVGPLWFQL